MTYMPWLVLGSVLAIFLLRGYRGSGREAGYIAERFRRFKQAGFDGSKVEVLFSDWRVDRYAAGSFDEMSIPQAAVYLCRDHKQQYFLWTILEPAWDKPRFRKLPADEAQAMLARSKTLLAELCPKQE